MASSVLVVPKAGENSNLGNISLQLSLLFEAASKGLLLFFFFSLIAAMMLSYRAWLRVGPQHVNEWSIASKAGSQDHLRLELWYPSSPDVRTEKCGAESWWGNTPGGQNRINLDDKNADASCH